MFLALAMLIPAPAAAGTITTLDPGSLIIPMDEPHQGGWAEVLPGYGLAWTLLQEGVPVHLVVDGAKVQGGIDLTAETTPLGGGTSIPRDYRGGPLVVAAADAAVALPIVTAWQGSWSTVVHELDVATSAEVERTLASAPTPVVLDDGNQDLAIDLLTVAGIDDPLGGAWLSDCDDSPTDSIVCTSEVEGTAGVVDGALFAADGLPAHCALLTMHADATDVTDEVRAELRAWLTGRPEVTLMGQCDAIDHLENGPDGSFLSTTGLTDNAVSNPVSYSDPAHPLVQFDGGWALVSGSWRGSDVLDALHPGIQGLITGANMRHSLIAGPMDGDPANGQVVYLSGHAYDAEDALEASGARVLLNTLLGAGCADDALQPAISLTGAPVGFDLQLDWSNAGPGFGRDTTLVLRLPAGLSWLTDDAGGTWDPAAGTVTWGLGTVQAGDGQLIAVDLADTPGTFDVTAELTWTVGATEHLVTWSDTLDLPFEPPTDTALPPTDTAPPTTDTATPPTTDTGLPPTDTGAPPTDGTSPEPWKYGSGACGCATPALPGALGLALLPWLVRRRRG